jgi:tetratricopeptide (TPR) repeat protein
LIRCAGVVHMKRTICIAASLILAASVAAFGQPVTLPPDGDNQRSIVTQQIGLVRVTIEYSSPDVHGPNGQDRRGKIWGALVPYGIHDLGFNNRKGPWRAGANENTVFAVSHLVKIQGQPLPAGRYGLHMLAGEKDWTVIFSKNSTAWGSFTYEQAEDAMRVTVTPEKAPYREWLAYDFVERRPDRATVALHWEELRVPFTVTVDDMATLYINNLRDELRGYAGFQWQNWNSAAQYCLQQDRNLEEALKWAEYASGNQFVGQANFTTLSTKAQILDKLSRSAEAATVMATALDLPSAQPIEIHQYGRRLLAQGKSKDALAVFQKNAKRFGDTWPVHVGLARGYSAVGDYSAALKHAEIALKQAPDPVNKKSLEDAVVKLKQGRDMNATN